MKNYSKILAVLAALVIISTSSSSGLYALEKEKSSWYIGFGLGYCDGGLTFSGKESSFNDLTEGLDSNKVAINFGVGAILMPTLHLGFDVTAMGLVAVGEIGSQGTFEDVSVFIYNYLAMITYFPMTTGPFLRAGAGVSMYNAQINFGSAHYSKSDVGFGCLAGFGYAFWLGKTFNLALNFDYTFQKYPKKEYKPEDSHFWTIYVSCYWF
jgi:hypothetical protein